MKYRTAFFFVKWDYTKKDAVLCWRYGNFVSYDTNLPRKQHHRNNFERGKQNGKCISCSPVG